jgi:hypothetical protein
MVKLFKFIHFGLWLFRLQRLNQREKSAKLTEFQGISLIILRQIGRKSEVLSFPFDKDSFPQKQKSPGFWPGLP